MENRKTQETDISLNLQNIDEDSPKADGGGDSTGGTGNDGGNTGGNG
ncbi:hypothetical protein [uncultured Tenacibaculum sp.]|nr:hypothetical protein [uncultured Tenacibaculum sp.]